MKKEIRMKIKAVAAAGILIIATMFGINSCSSDSTNEHYPEQTIDPWTLNAGTKNFKIYKEEGVSPTNLNRILDFMNEVCDEDILWLATYGLYTTKLETEINEIHIGAWETERVGDVMKINFNAKIPDIYLLMIGIANGTITLDESLDDFKLTKEFENPMETIRLAMARTRNQRRA